MTLPYPSDVSRRAQRAFLWAIVATIGDLQGRDHAASQQFLENLQFHVQYLAQVIPEDHAVDRAGLEALHSHLVHWLRTFLTKFDEMTDEEWQQGQRERSFWADVYRTIDDA